MFGISAALSRSYISFASRRKSHADFFAVPAPPSWAPPSEQRQPDPPGATGVLSPEEEILKTTRFMV
jgi:hypothetical protein